MCAACTTSTRDLADGFAQAGFSTVAIDYFARTAGNSARDEAFAYRPHVEQTTPETVDTDVAAAIAYLRSPPASCGHAHLHPWASALAAAPRGGSQLRRTG
ncbi:MAG: hypothetical protein R2853_04825 [Thermomicrobiales bacterium]